MRRKYLVTFSVVELVIMAIAMALKNEAVVVSSAVALIVIGAIGLSLAIADWSKR